MNKFDELFSKKLANHEVSPSERANRLFLERIAATKQKPLFWTSGRKYFSAAASIALVVGFAYIYTPSTEKVQELAKLDETKKVEPSKMAFPNLPSNSIAKITKEEAVSLKTLASQSLNSIKLKSKGLMIEPSMEVAKIRSLNEDETMDKAVEMIHETSVTQAKELLAVVDQTPDDTYILLTPTEDLVAVSEIPSIEDQVLDFVVEEDHAEGLLTKIFEEVKHLKKGEHLDFTKFGLKNLNEEGFIVQETQKIRNTITRIKSIFNN